MNSMASRATEPTHARARPEKTTEKTRRRVRSSARAPSPPDARRRRRHECRGHERPGFYFTFHHKVGRMLPSVMDTLVDARVIAKTPRTGACTIQTSETVRSHRWYSMDTWVRRGRRVVHSKVTRKCVSTNTRHHGDRHSPYIVSHQAFTPAENQPSPSEQGT